MALNTTPRTTEGMIGDSAAGGDTGSEKAVYRTTMGVNNPGVSNGPIHDPGIIGAAGLVQHPVTIPDTDHPAQPTLGDAPDSN